MKRLLVVGVLGLLGWALTSPEVSAFFCHRKWRRCCGVTHITCRPYNAFTPICWGNLVCDGCCPSPCGVASGCMPFGGYAPWGGAMACAPGFGYDSSPLFGGGACAPSVLPGTSAPGTVPAPPGVPVPPGAPASPMFTPPPPTPSTTFYNPYGYGYGVQRAGYYPGYAQNYNRGYATNPYQNYYNYALAYNAMWNQYYGNNPYAYGYGR